MARQKVYPQPWRKNMEAYNNFSGGLNSTTANDNLLDSEMTDLTNVDLAERGMLKRRNGMLAELHLIKLATWGDIGPKKWSEM